jgi:hypothetical protein
VRTYSVGLLETFGHPEVIVFGLIGEAANCALAGLIDRFPRKGATMPLNEPIDGVFKELPAILKSVPAMVGAPYALIAQAEATARHVPFSLVQLVWPDLLGHFPWEQDFDRSFVELQPQLHGDVSERVVPIAQARQARAAASRWRVRV